MTGLLPLALRSLLARRFTVALTLISIALSVMLLLGVEKLRTETRSGFRAAVSGTDLIVGARTSPVQLLLYSVFHIGDATANLRFESYEQIRRHPMVAWSLPLALGDGHRGFPVLGTDAGYLTHFRYGADRTLVLQQGVWFDDLFDVVLGAEVAAALGYSVADELVLGHGGGGVSFSNHDALPFRVSGVLARTGTPVDRTLHVSLAAIEVMHVGWESGVALPGRTLTPAAARARAGAGQPEQLSAFLLGVGSPAAVFQLQQAINGYREEPLQAILPAVALARFFSMVGIAEDALLLVSALVVLAGLAGMMTMLLASLAERRREMAILRSVGARPHQILLLLTLEATLLAAAGAALGVLLLQLLVVTLGPWLESSAGIVLTTGMLSAREGVLLGLVVLGGMLSGLVPAALAYRRSLADGLTPRI